MNAQVTEYLGDRPWIQTISGRAFPLVDAEPDDVYWPDVLYALAHITRFAGHAGNYTVGQHTIHPLNELPEKIRPYWLLHDAHEFAIGDITRPAANAIQIEAARIRASNGSMVASALCSIKHGLDYAIHTAAGVDWPLSSDLLDAVRTTDARMAITERRDLFGPAIAPWYTYPDDSKPFNRPIYSVFGPRLTYKWLRQSFHEMLHIDVPDLSEFLVDIDRRRSAS